MEKLKNKKKGVFFIGIAALICLLIGLSIYIFGADPVIYIKPKTGYISPSGIVIDNTTAYVSDATSNKIYSINLTNNNVSDVKYNATQKVNNVYSKDGYVYSLEGELAGTIVRLNADSLTVDKTIETGHTPSDMIIHDGKMYVSCRFSNKVFVYDEATMSKESDIDVSCQPIAMVVAGNNLYVAGHLNEKPVDGKEVASAEISVINTVDDTLVKNIPLLNGCGQVKDICISADGKYVYASSIMARYTYPTTQIDRGWINTNGISIIQTSDNTLVTAVMLDNLEEGAANPWGMAISGAQLIVAISGTDEVIIVDTTQMLKNIDNVKNNSSDKLVDTVADISNYLPFMDNCKTRIHVGSKGLRNVAAYNGKAYVCGYFEGDVSVVDYSSKKLEGKIPLGSQPEQDQIRKGEVLWNDASIGYQKWESCASCHPEARADGINWDTLSDGIGNFRNTKSLLNSHFTPPFLISGTGEMAEDGIRGSFGNLVYAALSEEDMNAVDEYLKSLVPVSSPYLNRDGTLTESAQRGRALFEQRCIGCHSGPYFTDMKLHNEGGIKKGPIDEKIPFDTPTLVEVWRTGPWLYTGKHVTMPDALTSHVELSLEPAELEDLSNYVLSIGAEGELYRPEQIKMTLSDNTMTYNRLVPDSKIYEVSIRKQWNTDKRARVIITLYNADDTQIASEAEDLEVMDLGGIAKIPVNINVPKDLSVDSYYTISIVDADNPTEQLATDFVITQNP